MNILPDGYVGFAIDKAYRSDNEASAIITTACLDRIPYRIVQKPTDVQDNEIAVGNIKFIQKVLGKIVTPNYYPEYLDSFLKRKTWFTNEWPLGKKVFIKPSDEYKRFTGFITNGGYKGKKRGPYVCSEVIKITNEWRYYVCNGIVLCAGWYAGTNDVEVPAPPLDVTFNKDLCACVDMGTLENGELVLIEQQHAFACGWYGKMTPFSIRLYAQWIAYGWDYTKRTT